MACVYILYSPALDRFYTGATSISVQERLNRHASFYYSNKFTAKVRDWKIYLEIECESMQEALYIEAHIKKMKSKKYIANLKNYPEIITKLKSGFNDS